MIFRPIRVLVTSILLTLFGFIVMFLYTLMQPLCIDDLAEISEIASLRAEQGYTDPMNINVAFDKEKNQWCYIEVIE
ncbi:hypothetical protein [Shewanella glacialipiscicola]|uniref:hypothetical protein n=1 Tax=Shewanella glacialipiscicola TaxID=614069 RepID=UPI003D79A0ED